jgi:hypothetical protein
MAISKLKNVKVKGHDQMSAELIKEGGQDLKKFISKIWEEEIIPHEWILRCDIPVVYFSHCTIGERVFRLLNTTI